MSDYIDTANCSIQYREKVENRIWQRFNDRHVKVQPCAQGLSAATVVSYVLKTFCQKWDYSWRLAIQEFIKRLSILVVFWYI